MRASCELTHHLFLAQRNGKITGIDFPLYPVSLTIPSGNFNKNNVFQTRTGSILIAREENPEGRKSELPLVEAEYEGVGFFANPGNRFRLRSPKEQYSFTRKMELEGVRVPHILCLDGQTQWMEYLPNVQDLSKIWTSGDKKAPEKTVTVLHALRDVHEKGIVFGDRWGPNELVGKDGMVTFADFDIKIWGPEAREFEIASLLYFTTHFADQGKFFPRSLLMSAFKNFLSEDKTKKAYSMNILKKYLLNYFQYFSTKDIYSWRDKKDMLVFGKELTEKI